MCRQLIYPGFAISTLILSLVSPTEAGDWIGFRGGEHYGFASAENLPVSWGDNENILWKFELPGLGSSSPIVVGDRLFITCYSGYAELIEEPGEMDNLRRQIVCLDKTSGDVLWTKTIAPVLPESRYSPGNDSRHGYASSTPTSDGERLYVQFGKTGVYCFDLDGTQRWQAVVGSGTHGWGSGMSPLLAGDLLIVNASVESESLIGFDKRTGKEIWRTDGIKKCWSSPVLVDTEEGREVILNLPKKLAAFDPTTGEELWHCDGIPDNYVCPSPIVHGGIIYAIGGRKNTTIAVRPGGRGDVSESHVLWRANKGSNVSSPVFVEGNLFWLHESRGIAYCLDAETGEVIYEERLSPRPGLIYSSITAANGKLYALSQDNGAYVLATNPDEMEQLAVNSFESDTSRCNGSVAIVDNRLYLRTDKAIYCIGYN
ncbi:MAG: PQQ-binding-like beta-propeller repeat protein [Pirellulales bacterium]